MQGDAAAASTQIDWFKGRDDEYLSLDLQASQAIVLGQRRRASALLRAAAVGARRRNLQGPADMLLEAAAADPYGACQVEDDLIGSLRACADADAALAGAEKAARERQADTLLNDVHLPIRRAAVELRRKRPANAIRLLEAVGPFERAYPEAVYLRGTAYLQMGDNAAAAAEFRKLIAEKGGSWGPRYAQAHLGLARAVLRSGDAVAAKKAYEALLSLWKGADDDRPLLVEARQEYAAIR
jgi:tetratricopeptide (TPR) repeat protein